ncbi:hypothetical protein RTP6_004284 [Batrachochytrium dendrobatidis]
MWDQPALDIAHQRLPDADTPIANLKEEGITIPRVSSGTFPVPSNLPQQQQHAMTATSTQSKMTAKAGSILAGLHAKDSVASFKSTSAPGSAPGTPPRSDGIPFLANAMASQFEKKSGLAEHNAVHMNESPNFLLKGIKNQYVNQKSASKIDSSYLESHKVKTQDSATLSFTDISTAAPNIPASASFSSFAPDTSFSNTASGFQSALGLSKQAAHSSSTTSVNPQRLIESGKLKTITWSDLAVCLRMAEARSISNANQPLSSTPEICIPDASNEWTQPAIPLLIDMRSHSENEKISIKNSVHASFPALLIKRFKRLAVSNFNLSNFLTSNDSCEIYAKWRQAVLDNRDKNVRCVVIIYDQYMSTLNTDSEAWAFASVLAESMSADLIKYRPTQNSTATASTDFSVENADNTITEDQSNKVVIEVAYMAGGMSAFLNHPETRYFLKCGKSDQMSSQVQDLNISATPNISDVASYHPEVHSKRLSLSIGKDTNNNFNASRSQNKPRLALKNKGIPEVEPLSSLLSNSSTMSKTASSNGNGIILTKKERPSLTLDLASSSKNNSFPNKSNLAIDIAPASPIVKNGFDGQSCSDLPKIQSYETDMDVDTSLTDVSTKYDSTDRLRKYSDQDTINQQSDSPMTSPNDNAAPSNPYSVVTPNIILGSDELPLCSNAVEQLSALGVTHILNMAAEIKNSPAVVESARFSIKWLPVLDNTEQDMDGPLAEAIEFISNAINTNPKAVVFVHCKAGRSRSVSVVIGYLVTTAKYTLKSAYEMVRKIRKGVSPNLGFMAALVNVERDVYGENSQIAQLYD